MRENQIRDFFYIRNKYHPTTVAFDVDWEASSDGQIIVSYAVAHCAQCDSFSKKIGRAIATGRLKSVPTTISVDADLTDNGDMWHDIRMNIAVKVQDKIDNLMDRHGTWYFGAKHASSSEMFGAAAWRTVRD